MASVPSRGVTAAVLLTGLVLCQAVLYGPSLIGQKVLLPLNLLARPGYYLPDSPENRKIRTRNVVLSDRTLYYVFERELAARELRAGRFPLWNPYGYAGAPLGSLTTYSPFNFIYYLAPGPFAFAWIELFVALTAGLGAFLFFRRVLGVDRFPALLGGWAFPLGGFFMLWQGFPLLHAVAWLPWMLLGVEACLRRPAGWGGPGLALVSAFSMWGGQLALHVLLSAGLYFCWRLVALHGWRAALRRPALGAMLATGLGFGLGMMLGSPDWLHLQSYAQSSARMIERAKGHEDRPPVGLVALPQTVLPDIYGSHAEGEIRLADEPRLESSAAAYPGLIIALLLAPLAFCRREHRGWGILWCVLVFLSLGWVLDVPGLVGILKLPGLNILSHNRAVFIAAFATLCLAVLGFDGVLKGTAAWRGWFWIPIALIAGLGTYSAYRLASPPEPVASTLGALVEQGTASKAAPDMRAVAEIQANYRAGMLRALIVCGLALLGWLWLGIRPRHLWLPRVFAGMAIVELLWFDIGLNPQADPRLYYPRLDVLTRLQGAPAGRILCVGCLPARLNESHRLPDIRGYDGFDPLRLLEVLEIARDKRVPAPDYAKLQWYVPEISMSSFGRLLLSPVLDMLNVRYLIFRMPRPRNIKPLFETDGYWVVENRLALPRAYVPRRVVTLPSEGAVLQAMRKADFVPADVAYVTRDTGLSGPGRGSATIVSPSPTELGVTVRMESAGLLVLADLWYKGWVAFLDGKRVPILRVNHALRGVVVPAGKSALRFVYQPASFRLGLALAGASIAACLLWCLWIGMRTRGRARVRQTG